MSLKLYELEILVGIHEELHNSELGQDALSGKVLGCKSNDEAQHR